MVRQWMSELASGARPVAQNGATVRAPSEAEIAILTGMFPDLERKVGLGVLQRSWLASRHLRARLSGSSVERRIFLRGDVPETPCGSSVQCKRGA